MKNRLITGIIFIVLGLLIAVGPLSIFPVCGVHGKEDSSMSEMELSSDHENTVMQPNNNTMANMDDKPSEDNASSTMVMKCHWTARAELGIGILIAILGSLLIVFKSKQLQLGLNISIGLNGILAFLIPTVLIGVCESTHMACRTLTLPALSVISGIVTFASIINSVYLLKADREGYI